MKETHVFDHSNLYHLGIKFSYSVPDNLLAMLHSYFIGKPGNIALRMQFGYLAIKLIS